VIASSFAPIHARNNINLGQLMADHAVLVRLQAGETIPLAEFTAQYDEIRRAIVEEGGLFAFDASVVSGERTISTPELVDRPMTMAEKLLAAHLVGGTQESCVRPGEDVLVRVDGGYSHEFTTAQVHHFLQETYGTDYTIQTPAKFAVFEDHLLYADGVGLMAPHIDKIETLRRLQREFQAHTGCRDYSAHDGISPGICHQVAREQFIDAGDFIQATDSHTCMGGASNALAWGVGATQYAGLVHSGFTGVRVPESIRFELTGVLAEGVTAKDLMLEILRTHAVEESTLDRVMEFGGPGLTTLSIDERATLTNMATECSARSGICEGDEALAEWIAARRDGVSAAEVAQRFVTPDEGAEYAGGVHTVDLATIRPMVAQPGDPTYGAEVHELAEVAIDIAYGGSCTAGKEADLDFYARVLAEADAAGLGVADGVHMYIQFGSESVRDYAAERGYIELFERAGVQVIQPGCGACIGCGPGVSEDADQTTVSAINRNFQGRSGPGRLYLASPLTVAASAVIGHITAFTPGMFVSQSAEVTTPS
jgi:3-isopropylmalate/(R)-2-methylmalate dehydratase large subunit